MEGLLGGTIVVSGVALIPATFATFAFWLVGGEVNQQLIEFLAIAWGAVSPAWLFMFGLIINDFRSRRAS